MNKRDENGRCTRTDRDNNGGAKQSGRNVHFVTVNTITGDRESVLDAPTMEISKEVQQINNSGDVWKEDIIVVNDS